MEPLSSLLDDVLSTFFIYIFLIFRGITLKEALDIAYVENENDNSVSAVYVEPPESNILTDEDSADEDDAGFIDNLNRNQLCSGAEIVFSNNTRIGGVAEDTITERPTLDQPSTTTAAPPSSTSAPPDRGTIIITRPQKTNFCKEGDLSPILYPFPDPDYTRYAVLSPVQLFELFFSEELLQEIVNQTTNYALFKNCHSPNVSIEDLKVFLGILILSGYNNLPSKRSYWETAKDMRNEMVVEAMRRDRFLQICRFIHFANNNSIDPADKMYKLRPLTDFLKAKFIEHFVPEQNLCYDESMIRYYGRHGCKQFIRGKPIRFGYKVWSFNTPSGYLINFEIYQGRNPRSNRLYEEIFGKAAAPLVQMIEDLGEKRNYRYNFYFDNLFCGMNLLYTLKNNGYGATGTIRDNRIPKESVLEDKKQFSKRARGAICSALEKTCGIIYVRWMDNSVVTIASTCYGVSPTRLVERFSREEKRNILVPRPNIVTQYNHYMGGTDLMDSNVSSYRIGIRAKKWYWPIFTYTVDVTIQNAWTLYRKTGRNISHLEFRRAIVQTYLTRYKNPPKASGRVSAAAASDSRVADNIRYDGLHHYVISVPENKRRRCAGTGCSSRGRTMCCKCDVGLCIDCFRNFHIK